MKIATHNRTLLAVVAIGLFFTNQVAAQAPSVSNPFPAPNSFSHLTINSVSATITPATPAQLYVNSFQEGGRRSGSVTTTNGTTSFVTTVPFKAGESFSATISSLAGARYVWQFTAAVAGGSGTFEPGVITPISTQSWSQDYMAIVDVDGDHDLDVLVPYYLGGRFCLGLLRNDGTGNFATLVDLNIATQRFLPADIDGDGDLDIVCGNSGGSGLNILFNNGTGAFTPAPVSNTIITSTTVASLALGDLDADGDVDLVFAEGSNKSLNIRLNNGSGVFTGTAQVGLSSTAQRIELADVDNDGDLDALTGNGLSTIGSLNIRLNNGQGQFSGTTSLPVGGYRGTIGLADFDNDGDLDIAVPLFQPNGKLSFWNNNGNGTFVQAPELFIGNAPQVVAIGDVDGDNDLDIVTDARASSASGADINLNLNIGLGNFTRQTSIPTSAFSTDLALADMDNDGDLDLVVYTLGGNSTTSIGAIAMHRNAGTPSPTVPNASIQKPAVIAWPNPVEHGTALNFEVSAGAKSGQATLYNTLGHSVRQLSFQGNNLTLPTTGLLPGIYTFIIISGDKSITQRVIIQ